MKKLSSKKEEDQIKALKLCANVLSLDEISRMTGVRLELLRRFINRTANDARAETWDKVYPVIKPYLTGLEDIPAPKRIGPAYRRKASRRYERLTRNKKASCRICIQKNEAYPSQNTTSSAERSC